MDNILQEENSIAYTAYFMTLTVLSIFIVIVVYFLIKQYSKKIPYEKVNQTLSTNTGRELQTMSQDDDNIFDLNGV